MPLMSAHAVFRGTGPAFRRNLQLWLDLRCALGNLKSTDSSLELTTDEPTLIALLDSVKTPKGSTQGLGIQEFHLAVFALDDDRCEMVTGRFAQEEKSLHRALPAMGSTPRSLAAARQRARTAVVS